MVSSLVVMRVESDSDRRVSISCAPPSFKVILAISKRQRGEEIDLSMEEEACHRSKWTLKYVLVFDHLVPLKGSEYSGFRAQSERPVSIAIANSSSPFLLLS